MKRIVKLVFLIFTSFFSLIVFGGKCTACKKDDLSKKCIEVTYQGLIPYGPDVVVGNVTIECQLCPFFVMAKDRLNFFLFRLVFLVSAFLFAIGGFKFLFAGENQNFLREGKSTMISVLYSLLIIFSSWTVMNIFFLGIGVADWTGLKEGWFKINCPIYF